MRVLHRPACWRAEATTANVVDALAEMTQGLTVGDPSDPATDIGPLVAQRQQERSEEYINVGQQEGAKIVVGGNGLPAGLSRGWYVRPTLFADATNTMRISREEIFGPVVTVIRSTTSTTPCT